MELERDMEMEEQILSLTDAPYAELDWTGTESLRGREGYILRVPKGAWVDEDAIAKLPIPVEVQYGD